MKKILMIALGVFIVLGARFSIGKRYMPSKISKMVTAPTGAAAEVQGVVKGLLEGTVMSLTERSYDKAGGYSLLSC